MFPFSALTYIHRWQSKKPHVFNLNLHLSLKKCHMAGKAGRLVEDNQVKDVWQGKTLTAA
jgi:hypothetical protein